MAPCYWSFKSASQRKELLSEPLRLPQSKIFCLTGGRREFVWYQINRSHHHIWYSSNWNGQSWSSSARKADVNIVEDKHHQHQQQQQLVEEQKKATNFLHPGFLFSVAPAPDRTQIEGISLHHSVGIVLDLCLCCICICVCIIVFCCSICDFYLLSVSSLICICICKEGIGGRYRSSVPITFLWVTPRPACLDACLPLLMPQSRNQEMPSGNFFKLDGQKMSPPHFTPFLTP